MLRRPNIVSLCRINSNNNNNNNNNNNDIRDSTVGINEARGWTATELSFVLQQDKTLFSQDVPTGSGALPAY
jgi:hypothetical protein